MGNWIRCERCGRDGDPLDEATWIVTDDGANDPDGVATGICPGCMTRAENAAFYDVALDEDNE